MKIDARKPYNQMDMSDPATPTAAELTPLTIEQVASWQAMPWLWHGFSTRPGGLSTVYAADGRGELNLGFTSQDEAERVRANRQRYVQSVTGSSAMPLVTVRQVHSAVTVVVGRDGSSAASGRELQEADGLITSQPGCLLGILTADCLPVLVVDPVTRAVGAFHAGWRGTVAAIVASGVARMQAEFGSDPAQMLAAIGPGIGACCYRVGAEVRREFLGAFADAETLFSHVLETGEAQLDLAEANRRQLVAAGLEAGKIAQAGGCTRCHPERYFSHRGGCGHAGRMMAVIGVRE